jgi:hypothetical protein
MFWLGWVLTILPCLLLLLSASFKFIKGPDFEKGIEHIGWTVSKMTVLGILEISCTILYLIPETAVLGAILLAAYLGGATATHVRVDDPFFMPILAGVLVWLGLWLREPRLRALTPFRQG